MSEEKEMTVREYVKWKGCKKIWLCPSLVSDGRISTDPILTGIECSDWGIPERIRNKKVRRHYVEEGFECIIWENDEDVSFDEVPEGRSF